MDNFDLKQYLAENKLNEAEGRDLYKTAGEMISQVGLFTQEIADELEAENRGNLYRFFNTPEEKAELIKISEAYPAYLAKVKAMMDELMSDPLYQVAVGDAKRDNALEKAYYRAKMYNMYK
jgi:aromatic ring hydroxylase